MRGKGHKYDGSRAVPRLPEPRWTDLCCQCEDPLLRVVQACCECRTAASTAGKGGNDVQSEDDDGSGGNRTGAS